MNYKDLNLVQEARTALERLLVSWEAMAAAQTRLASAVERAATVLEASRDPDTAIWVNVRKFS